MSESQTVEAVEAVEAEASERAASVSIWDALEVYIPAAAEGKSMAQIAEQLGMNEDSLATKISTERTKLLAETSTFKDGDRVVSGEQLIEESKNAESDASKRLTHRQLLKETERYPMVTRGTEIPHLKRGGRAAVDRSKLAGLVQRLVGATEQTEQSEQVDAATDGETPDSE